MAPGWFGQWRLIAAIRKYAGRFGATLLHDYGASDFYTAGQIEHMAKKFAGTLLVDTGIGLFRAIAGEQLFQRWRQYPVRCPSP